VGGIIESLKTVALRGNCDKVHGHGAESIYFSIFPTFFNILVLMGHLFPSAGVLKFCTGLQSCIKRFVYGGGGGGGLFMVLLSTVTFKCESPKNLQK
jgi:hypothetical protein